jgi:hypothetical protein
LDKPVKWCRLYLNLKKLSLCYPPADGKDGPCQHFKNRERNSVLMRWGSWRRLVVCLAVGGALWRAASASADAPTTQPATRPSVADQFRPLGVRSVIPDQDGLGIKAPAANADQNNFYPVPDRWRVGIPGDYVQNTRNDTIFDPYGENVLKGDYPILDQDKFLILTATSDTLYEYHKLPSASGISTDRPGSDEFYGEGYQSVLNQDFVESVDFFKGDADYRPRDFEIKETGVFDLDYLHTSELGQVNPDVRDGTERNVTFFGFQELFAEYKIADVSPNFDILSVRVGIQDFNQDFRGFLYNDQEPGVRLFGNLQSNKIQYNLAAFYMLEKDTNTGLNTFNERDQGVILANIFGQDFIWPGYTAELSAAANYDNPSLVYDRNGNIARPEPIGTISEKAVRAYYIGWAGDGHIGRFNISHQFYQALGEESFNAIAGRQTQIDAQFGAVELSYDSDYTRYRASFVYVSGDHDYSDNKATGFDSIFDNPNFFGGGFDFFTRESIALLNTKVNLTNRNSFYPDLRTSKEEGQANFVNPGLWVYNVGLDYELTPTVSLISNVSYLMFDSTDVLQTVEHDNTLDDRDLGLDYSLGIRYRPLLNNNVIVTVGTSFLTPFAEFSRIYDSSTLYATFVALTFTY